MYNPFQEASGIDTKDLELIHLSLDGDEKALENLILRHQRWIYNVALRMVWEPADAEEVTQEILIKMITNLSGFRGESAFRTWLFKIVKNHVVNMRKKPMEKDMKDFPTFSQVLEDLEDGDLPDPNSVPVELSVLVEETEIGCMAGMMLCMDREQRLIHMLGSIFGVSDAVGAEIFEISKDNYCQRLSRARKQLTNFLNEECGLINKNNPCRCEKKTRAAIKAGFVDPANLRFVDAHVKKVRDVAGERTEQWDDFLEKAYVDIYQDQPYLKGPEFRERMRAMINSPELKKMYEV